MTSWWRLAKCSGRSREPARTIDLNFNLIVELVRRRRTAQLSLASTRPDSYFLSPESFNSLARLELEL